MKRLNLFKYFIIALTLMLQATLLEASVREENMSVKSVLKPQIVSLKIPFVKNQNPDQNQVAFHAQTFSGTLFVTKNGQLVFHLIQNGPEKDTSQVIQETILNGLPVTPTGLEKSHIKVNYFKGEDPKNWHKGLETFNSITLGEIYENIELSLKAYGNNIEKLFHVFPGASPQTIQIQLEGALNLHINPAGELVVTTRQGNISFTRPIAYQLENGSRRLIPVEYTISGNTYGFVTQAYDIRKELIIDPLISTYIGGARTDQGFVTATHTLIDRKPWLYIAGQTTSNDFPGTGMYQTNNGYNQDAFIALINMDMSQVQFTYLGGHGKDAIYDMAIRHPDGDVYVVGETDGNFPVPYAGGRGGGRDCFIARLSWDLNELEHSRYLGGKQTDVALGIALYDDPLGDSNEEDLYVTGYTYSDDFPGTENGVQKTKAGSISLPDAFVARLSMDMGRRTATYLGCYSSEYGQAIAVHPFEPHDVYVLVKSFYDNRSPDPDRLKKTCFPWTDDENSPFNGSTDATIVKLAHDLKYTTTPKVVHYGGPQLEFPQAIAIHPSTGNIYIAGGRTKEEDGRAVDQDAFVAYYDQDLNQLLGDTLLGDKDSGLRYEDRAHDLKIIPGVGIYAMGWTKSPDFDGTAGGILPNLRGGTDIFLSRFHNNLDLEQSTYIGSIGNDETFGRGLSLSKDFSQEGDHWYAFVGGTISSTGLVGINQETAFQPEYKGGYDVLAAVMNADLKPDPIPDIEVQPRQLDFKNNRLNMASTPQRLTLENIGGTPLTLSSVTILGEGASDFSLDLTSDETACGDVFPKSLGQSATCKINVIFTPSIDNVMRTAIVRIVVANDPDEPVIDIPVKGYSGPDIDVVTRVDFPLTKIGETTYKTFQIKNVGYSDLIITSIQKAGIDDSTGEDFSIIYEAGGSFCPNPSVEPMILAPLRSCYLKLAFSPTRFGIQEAAMFIFSNDIDEDPSITSLIATGVTDLTANIWSHDLDFGNVAVGSSRSLPLILSSTGSEPLEVSGIAISDSNNFLYFPNSGAIPCGNLPITLAGTTFCTMSVIFRPLESGGFNETLTFVSNAPGESNLIINITGTGVADTDNDGIPNIEESTDGNHDGTLDSEQSHVATFRTFDHLHSIVIELESDAFTLSEVTTSEYPFEPLPEYLEGYEFPFGFFHFKVNLPSGTDSATIRIILPEGETVDTYFKYGPEFDNPDPHYYDFGHPIRYPGNVSIEDNVITLILEDGGAGDHDQVINLQISDPGSPARRIVLVGDLDGNGTINLKDVAACFSFLVGLKAESELKNKQDIDNDGKLEIGDLIHILQKIIKD